MRKIFLLSIFIIIPIFIIAGKWTQPEIWEDGLKKIVYLAPSDFTDLPKSIIKYLEKNNYKIPQPYFYNPGQEKYNVIKGRFYSPNQYDWAVMCSNEHKSKVIIFISGSTKKIHILTQFEDINGLQGIGNDEVGFSLGIEVVGREDILYYYEAYGGPKPPPIDHDGINFIFYGKASVVYYNYKGKWLELQGAD